MKNTTLEPFLVYACLPFVELAHENCIQMGPVLFWPASKYTQFIPEDSHSHFQRYLDSIAQIKTNTGEPGKLINTVKLSPQATTFISIEANIPDELKDIVLIDSLYLLYFACTFRNLYHSTEIPSFGAFRKMIPASSNFIHYKPSWEHLHIKEIDREQTVCIHLLDQNICKGFGKMLSAIYQPHSQISPHIINYKRTIRSIRYLVDRFFQRFVNLFESDLHLPDLLFEPEDVIFLSSSFESLFDLNDKDPAADFKHKLRPLLHLKYSKPVETFWKWVDDFYEVRRRIVHGGENPNPLFKLNPNFELSHILIGIKLFIYSVYYFLFKFELMHSKSYDLFTPPDFKWIHPEEILLFFWTESSLLRKLSHFVTRIVEEKSHDDELHADVHQLANLFTAMQERYYLNNDLTEIKFIPTPIHEISGHIHHILKSIEKAKQNKEQFQKLFKAFPPHFKKHLQYRLES